MQTASFRLLPYAAVYEWYMCILWTVQVYLDQIAVSSHLTPVGPCPDQGCQSFRGACFSPKPLPTDIVRKHTVTQCMYYDPDLIWPYGQNIVTWQHLYSFAKYTDTCWTNDLVIFTWYHSQPTPFDGDGLILFVGKPQRVGITCVLHFSFGQKYY